MKAAMGIGICSKCERHSGFRREDQGIGGYEFWGSRETHHNWQWVSECCEAPERGEVEELEEDK